MPLGKGDFILGYALAFGLLAIVRRRRSRSRSRCWVCGLEIEGSIWLLFLVAVTDALLGTSLGLLASAFARTEFQVVQFMPVFVFPQILLGGIFLPRDQLPEVLEAISDWLPLSFAIDALQAVAADSEDDGLDRRQDPRASPRGSSARSSSGRSPCGAARLRRSRRPKSRHALADRAEHPVEVRVRETPLGVELVAHREEVVEARVDRRAASAASSVCILPQCGRPSWRAHDRLDRGEVLGGVLAEVAVHGDVARSRGRTRSTARCRRRGGAHLEREARCASPSRSMSALHLAQGRGHGLARQRVLHLAEAHRAVAW